MFLETNVSQNCFNAFFEGIMVMAEDPHVRHKRLCLLWELEFEMNRVADISKLAS